MSASPCGNCQYHCIFMALPGGNAWKGCFMIRFNNHFGFWDHLRVHILSSFAMSDGIFWKTSLLHIIRLGLRTCWSAKWFYGNHPCEVFNFFTGYLNARNRLIALLLTRGVAEIKIDPFWVATINGWMGNLSMKNWIILKASLKSIKHRPCSYMKFSE